MADDEVLALAWLILCKKRRKSRSVWCKDWLLKRKSYSHINLLNELKFSPKDWHNYLRMNEETYLHLLFLVTPLIQKSNTVMREAISPHERLSATLRFLATGRSYECMKFSTLISKQALSRIIPETCDALYKVLQKDYFKCERRTPQQASGGSPTLGTHMLAMDVTKEARASPLPVSAQQPATAPAQPPQPQVLQSNKKYEVHQDIDPTTQYMKICAGCSKVITERYLLKALDQLWHEDCLKCGCCDCRLGEVGHTLYTRANLILCKRDYLRLFGNTGYCAACNKVIPAFEMVMRARSNVYHLECFACQQCNHRFCVGDRFYLCDNKILCEYDYEERLVFANMAYNPPPLAHLKRQTTHLPPPPTNNAISSLMNGSSRSGDLNNNMSGSSPAPFVPPPHLKPLGLSASS